MDILEANRHAIQTTIHTEATSDWSSDGSCNRAGCYVNWGNTATTASGSLRRPGSSPGCRRGVQRRTPVRSIFACVP